VGQGDAHHLGRFTGGPQAMLESDEVGLVASYHAGHDEQDFAQPIVSVSLGLPASFAFYGLTRGGKGHSVALHDGDVLVWGGPSRLVYHAVRPVKPGHHPLTGEFRYNLTFRHAR